MKRNIVIVCLAVLFLTVAITASAAEVFLQFEPCDCRMDPKNVIADNYGWAQRECYWGGGAGSYYSVTLYWGNRTENRGRVTYTQDTFRNHYYLGVYPNTLQVVNGNVAKDYGTVHSLFVY